MKLSPESLLLVPCLIALAWVVAYVTKQPLAPVAVLLGGGVLLAGFVAPVQQMLAVGARQNDSRIAFAARVALRLAIGLFVLACVVLGLLWATASWVPAGT